MKSKHHRRAPAVAAPQIHDRRAPGPGRPGMIDAVVDDPLDGARIVVRRSVMHDPLAAMHAARQIDDAQYHAGRRWQRAIEVAQIGGLHGIDTTRERVDGGPIARATISDRQAKALQYLAWSRGLLGKLSYELIHDVLGRGLTVRQAAAERGRASEWDVRHAGRTFRDALTLLAVTKR